MPGEDGLDLAEFDAQAADLDLVVGAAEVDERTVGGPAGEVAGAVHPRSGRAVRVGDEPLGAQSGPAEVAAGQLHTGEVELSRGAGRGRAQRRVEDVGAGVPHGPADGHGAALGGALPAGDVDGRLGRSVEVVQPDARQHLEEAVLELLGERLAAADHPAQSGAAGGGRFLEEDVEHGGDEVRGRDPLGTDQPGQVVGVLVTLGAGDDERGAGDQGPEELPDGDIESGGRLLQDAVVGAEAVPVLHPQQPVGDGPVGDDGALGTAGGAGGVDDVRRVVAGRCRAAGRGAGLGGQPVRGVVRVQDEQGHWQLVRQARRRRRGGQQQRGPRVGEHEPDALGRVVGVHGEVGGARLDHREQGGHQFHGAGHGQGHEALRPDAPGAQQVGEEPVGSGVQFPVGQRAVLEAQGAGLGRAPGLLFEQLGQGGVRHGVRGVVVRP